VVQRIREEGGVVLGKTNLDEFAMGSSTENSALGVTRHPLHPDRVPGGSSGGSAAAVAAGMALVALGSETGGSVRQPAAFCGLVGVKPTYGRVSRYGLVAFASSLDCVGVLTRTVEDAALGTEVIAGPDPRDATCSDLPAPRLLEGLEAGVGGLRLGVPDEYLGRGLDSRARESFDRACGRLRQAGAEIVRVSLPHTRYVIAAYYILATAEASANLARYDGIRFGSGFPEEEDLVRSYTAVRSAGFGPEVKRRVILGTFVLSAGYYEAYYEKALRARARVKDDFEKVFAGGVDALLTPTSPFPAFRRGEKISDPLAMYLCDVYTAAVNLAGLPAVSVPVDPLPGNPALPMGLQIIGRSFDEATALRAARALEAAGKEGA
jgi:aspartyl-tRNA(Asn)/glutamyl-tRNA(Gln) amidotransferase subunit A